MSNTGGSLSNRRDYGVKILCLEILSHVQDSNAFITYHVGNSLLSDTVFHDYDVIAHYIQASFFMVGALHLSL